MSSNSRPRLSGLARWSLFWTLFIGLGAVLGAGMMWGAPDVFGMNPMLDYLQRLPFAEVFFTSWVWPGVFLFVVNGLTQLVAAALILLRSQAAAWAVLVCGLLLAGWIAIQFVIFPLNPISSLYLVFALVEVVLAVLWIRRRSIGVTVAPVTPN